MAKYDPLRTYLESLPDSVIDQSLSFDSIEEILKSKLPFSAFHHHAWWANNQYGSHIHARAWMVPGWKSSHVDLDRQTVRFIRAHQIKNTIPPKKNLST